SLQDITGTLLADLGRFEEAQQAYERAVAIQSRVPSIPRQDPRPRMLEAYYSNNLAWFLATCPDPRFRDSGRAVELAKKTVETDAKNAGFWNTLGVAHYRDGDWKAAVAALEKGMSLRNGGDGTDWYFLAMAHWQLDDQD